MMTRLKEASPALSEAASTGSVPTFLVAAGRGRTGKTTGLRFIVERAKHEGRDVIIADGDRSNQTLSAFFRDATRPRSAEDDDVHTWITSLLDRMAQERVSIVLDLGGGDRTMNIYGRDVGIVDFCEAVGARPVILFFIGPDIDDLAHVEAMQSAGAFLPASSAIVLNESLVRSGQTAANAFEPILRRPEFAQIMERGTKWVTMPRLACMPDLDANRTGFFQANQAALGPVRHFMVTDWQKKMEASFAPIGEWLP
ncbi:MAG: hypothetical protein JOY71_26010 [Acetobacteraceae bacterium]|nr:hypothetical protein [Acetobacteraceae bacterium]